VRYFVTGGAGFLGLAIVRALREAGHEIVTYSRGDYPELQELDIHHKRGDLGDLDRLIESSKNCDAVFHVAAKAGIWGPYGDYHRANVDGTLNVVHACRENEISKLVYTSTPSVVFDGRGSEGKNESLPYATHFLAHYPKTKAIAEEAVLKNNDENLATVALRPHLIWGPRDHHFLPRLVDKAKKGKLRFLGEEQYSVDSIYVENAARAHMLAMDCLEPGSSLAGRAYFLSQNEPIPISELINKILHAAGLPPVTKRISPRLAYAAGTVLETLYSTLGIEREPPMTRFLAKQLSTPHWYDVSAAEKDFGFRSEISIEEGMKRLRNWILETNPFGENQSIPPNRSPDQKG